MDTLPFKERIEMPRCCAWCRKVRLGEAWGMERRRGEVNYSHGICANCLAKGVLLGSSLEAPPHLPDPVQPREWNPPASA
jgi:hypothetical protein